MRYEVPGNAVNKQRILYVHISIPSPCFQWSIGQVRVKSLGASTIMRAPPLADVMDSMITIEQIHALSVA